MPTYFLCVCVCICAQSLNRVWLCNPMDCNLLGFSRFKNTRVACHALLQGVFLIQGSNPCLLRWQADSLSLAPRGKPSAQVCVCVCVSLLIWLSLQVCAGAPAEPLPGEGQQASHSRWDLTSSLRQKGVTSLVGWEYNGSVRYEV